jgi:hypothetical protein
MLHPYMLAAITVTIVAGVSALVGLVLFLTVDRLAHPRLRVNQRQMRLVLELSAIIGVWSTIGMPLLRYGTVGLVGAVARVGGFPMWESAGDPVREALAAAYVVRNGAPIRVSDPQLGPNVCP